MTASLPVGVAVALLLARGRFPGKAILNGIVHLPLVLPPVVTGYILLLLFGRRGPIGAWLEQTFGIVFAFRWTGAALACAVMGFPLMVRAIRLSLESQDPGLAEAAETLGAGSFDRLVSLHLPLAVPGILAGAITAFAACLGEFGAIITFVSNIPGETRTIPLAIYTAIQTPGGEAAAARLASLSIMLALLGLTLAEAVGRRAKRAIGQ